MEVNLNRPSPSSYSLYVDNLAEESRSDNESDLSSATEWEVRLDVSLHPLLFLKAEVANISVTDFSVSNLPLAVNTRDSLTLACYLDQEIVQSNRVINKTAVADINGKKLKLTLGNVRANKPQILLNYLNRKLACLNTYLII